MVRAELTGGRPTASVPPRVSPSASTVRPVAARTGPWIPLLVLGLAGLFSFLLWHRDYYLASIPDQPLHPRHDLLRSSGRVGLLFGLVGTLLLLVNLSYLVRRRLAQGRRFGSLRSWMNLHIGSGLLAVTCLILHSAAGVRSASAAVAAGTLTIVVVTGLLGRYLYAQLPRSIEGHELGLEQARRRLEGVAEALEGLGLRGLRIATGELPPARTRLETLVRIVRGETQVRRRYRAARRVLRAQSLPTPVRREIERTLRRFLRERQALTRFHELRDLMSSWRFLHRWLALVMFGAAASHIVLAVRYRDFFSTLNW